MFANLGITSPFCKLTRLHLIGFVVRQMQRECV